MATASLPNPSLLTRALELLVRIAPTGRKFFNQSIFLVRTLGDFGEAPALRGLESAWAGEREIEFMDAHPEATSRGAYARRAKRGDLCLCLKRGEEVIGYRWAKRASACLFCGFGSGYELLFFPLRPDQVFIYDSYVYSAYRDHGYSSLTRAVMYHALQREGVGEAYSLVAPENTKSLRLTLKSGNEPLCMAYGIRVRNWSKMILGPRSDPELERWIADFKRREGIAPVIRGDADRATGSLAVSEGGDAR